MEMTWWVAQGVGFAALLLVILNYQFSQRDTIMNIRMAASFLMAIHLALLVAWTGSAMSLLGTIRTYVFKERTRKKWAASPLWLYAFFLVIVVFTYVTWDGYVSIFASVGSLFGLFAFWSEQPTNIRLLAFCMAHSWLAYFVMTGSIPGMLTSIFEIFSVTAGIIRFDFFRKDEPTRLRKFMH